MADFSTVHPFCSKAGEGQISVKGVLGLVIEPTTLRRTLCLLRTMLMRVLNSSHLRLVPRRLQLLLFAEEVGGAAGSLVRP